MGYVPWFDKIVLPAYETEYDLKRGFDTILAECTLAIETPQFGQASWVSFLPYRYMFGHVCPTSSWSGKRAVFSILCRYFWRSHHASNCLLGSQERKVYKSHQTSSRLLSCEGVRVLVLPECARIFTYIRHVCWTSGSIQSKECFRANYSEPHNRLSNHDIWGVKSIFGGLGARASAWFIRVRNASAHDFANGRVGWRVVFDWEVIIPIA